MQIIIRIIVSFTFFTASAVYAQSCSINARGVVKGTCSSVSMSRTYTDKAGATKECKVTRGKPGEDCRYFDDVDAPRNPENLVVNTKRVLDDNEGIKTIDIRAGGELHLENPDEVETITVQSRGALFVSGSINGTVLALKGSSVDISGSTSSLEVAGGTVNVSGSVANLKVSSGKIHASGSVENLNVTGGALTVSGMVNNLTATAGNTVVFGTVLNLIGTEFVTVRTNR